MLSTHPADPHPASSALHCTRVTVWKCHHVRGCQPPVGWHCENKASRQAGGPGKDQGDAEEGTVSRAVQGSAQRQWTHVGGGDSEGPPMSPTGRARGEKLPQRAGEESGDRETPRLDGVRDSGMNGKAREGFSCKRNGHLESTPTSHAWRRDRQCGLSSAERSFCWSWPGSLVCLQSAEGRQAVRGPGAGALFSHHAAGRPGWFAWC